MICDSATKYYLLTLTLNRFSNQALDKMESEWKPVMLEVMPYKETGTFIMKVSDDCSQLLDDHIVMAQSMSFSPYKKPFEERITTWESKLVMTQEVQDSWQISVCIPFTA